MDLGAVSFVVAKEDLASAVSWVARNLPTKPAQPVLRAMLITADDDGLEFAGFDYEVSTKVRIPADAEAEIALLQVDSKGRPLKSYASQRLLGQGGALPFALSFDPQSLPGDGRFELRARVSQSGRLILRLPPQALNPTQSRDFGPLQLVRAP
mgnify:CR=1 FL=1